MVDQQEKVTNEQVNMKGDMMSTEDLVALQVFYDLVALIPCLFLRVRLTWNVRKEKSVRRTWKSLMTAAPVLLEPSETTR